MSDNPKKTGESEAQPDFREYLEDPQDVLDEEEQRWSQIQVRSKAEVERSAGKSFKIIGVS